MNIRRKIIYAVGIIAFLITLPFIYLGTLGIWYSLDDPKGSCVSAQFAVEKAGNEVVCDVRIQKWGGYSLELVYSHATDNLNRKRDRDRIWKIVGGPTRDTSGVHLEPGAPLELHVQVFQVTDVKSPQQKIDEYISSPKLTSWGGNDLYAEITSFPLDKGQYEVRVKSLKDAPEFSSVRTKLVFRNERMGK